MTTAPNRARLFGGALFVAGIVAGEAGAQGLAHSYSTGVIEADRITGTDPYFEPVSQAVLGFGTTSYGTADLFCAVVATTSEVSFIHNRPSSGTFSYSYAGVSSYAYVLVDTPVSLSWDLGAWEGAAFVVIDHANATAVFSAEDMSAGEMTLALDGGKLYQLAMLTKGAAAGGDSFARVEIAAPCAGDLDANGILNVEDVQMFVNSFLGGCP